jgi:hypothetical protein
MGLETGSSRILRIPDFAALAGLLRPGGNLRLDCILAGWLRQRPAAISALLVWRSSSFVPAQGVRCQPEDPAVETAVSALLLGFALGAEGSGLWQCC